MIVSWETNILCYVNECGKDRSALVRSFLKFNSEIHSGGVCRGLKCSEKAWGCRECREWAFSKEATTLLFLSRSDTGGCWRRVCGSCKRVGDVRREHCVITAEAQAAWLVGRTPKVSPGTTLTMALAEVAALLEVFEPRAARFLFLSQITTGTRSPGWLFRTQNHKIIY